MRRGFEWDATKAYSNWRKHGVSFEEAATVFDDPLAVTFPDPDHSDLEDRGIILGMSALAGILLVVYLERGLNVRVITARHATKRERKGYEEGEPN